MPCYFSSVQKHAMYYYNSVSLVHRLLLHSFSIIRLPPVILTSVLYIRYTNIVARQWWLESHSQFFNVSQENQESLKLTLKCVKPIPLCHIHGTCIIIIIESSELKH